MVELSAGCRNALYKHQKQMVALGGGKMQLVYLRGGLVGAVEVGRGVKLYPPVPRGLWESGAGEGGLSLPSSCLLPHSLTQDSVQIAAVVH